MLLFFATSFHFTNDNERSQHFHFDTTGKQQLKNTTPKQNTSSVSQASKIGALPNHVYSILLATILSVSRLLLFVSRSKAAYSSSRKSCLSLNKQPLKHLVGQGDGPKRSPQARSTLLTLPPILTPLPLRPPQKTPQTAHRLLPIRRITRRKPRAQRRLLQNPARKMQ